MKKIFSLSILLFCSFFLSGCTLFKKTPAALQINSNPPANVFVDGKSVGKTPYSASNLKEGEIVVKLVSDSPSVPWEGKLKLNSGILTLIDRELGGTDSLSSGQILTLERTKDSKSASISIVSDPDSSLIKIDGESKGFSPLSFDKFSEGEHEIIVSKDGYSEKIIKAKAKNGYRLIISVKLAGGATPTPTPTPTGPTPTVSKSKITPTPIKKTTLSPVPTKSAGQSDIYVTIKDTPTGWLRVRSGASTTAEEVAKVNPGEKYLLIEEKSGWYKIQYSEGKEGWISSTYAKKE